MKQIHNPNAFIIKIREIESDLSEVSEFDLSVTNKGFMREFT